MYTFIYLSQNDTKILYTALVDCGTPEIPTNGMVMFNSTKLGSIANYRCNEGCSLDGAVQRICEHNNQWSDSIPQCQGKLYQNFIGSLITINVL